MLEGYPLSVSEVAPMGTPVGTVVATDNDGGLNGTVSSFLTKIHNSVLCRFLGWT